LFFVAVSGQLELVPMQVALRELSIPAALRCHSVFARVLIDLGVGAALVLVWNSLTDQGFGLPLGFLLAFYSRHQLLSIRVAQVLCSPSFPAAAPLFFLRRSSARLNVCKTVTKDFCFSDCVRKPVSLLSHQIKRLEFF
jgi:hypothetical protein